jgi:two-component system LytT family response regulator
VIFTTASSDHAVRAFEINALDYLVKPVEPTRLAAALERVQGVHGVHGVQGKAVAAAGAPAPVEPLARLFVQDGARCWFVPLREVRLLASEGNFVRLYWGDAQPSLASSLVALEPRLAADVFFRANRHQIVNLDFIAAVEVGVAGRLQLRHDLPDPAATAARVPR